MPSSGLGVLARVQVDPLSGESRWSPSTAARSQPDGRGQWTVGVILDITRQKATEKSRELVERHFSIRPCTTH